MRERERERERVAMPNYCRELQASMQKKNNMPIEEVLVSVPCNNKG